MRQFEWRWLYGSIWVSVLHIPVACRCGSQVDTWGLHAFVCKMAPAVVSQVIMPSTTSSHVRLPQPKFQSRRYLLVWRRLGKHPNGLAFDTLERGLSLTRDVSRYHAGRFIHFSLCILRWRRSWDGSVQKTSQVRHVVRFVHFPADCFGNIGPNQRIGCEIHERFGPQIISASADDNNLFQRLSIILQRFNTIYCIRYLGGTTTGPLAEQLFKICLAFNPRDLYYRGY